MKNLLLPVMLFLGLFTLHGQIPMEQVYIHTDRDVYGPSDEIRFKAYLKNNNKSVSAGSQLFMLLINPSGSLVADSIYTLNRNKNSGSLMIPDSLAEGEYQIVAYTDRMDTGKPEDAFSRKIIIRKNEIDGLFINLTPDASYYNPGDVARIGIRIGFQNQLIYNNDHFNYLASKDGVPFQTGTGKTDSEGSAGLSIQIPADTVEGLITLAVSAGYKKYHGSVSIQLPAAGMPVFLNFFPEGGTFVDGLDTKVAFHAQDFEGNPFEFEGVIFDQDDEPYDTIRCNNLGIGSFQITPDLTDPLKVRIIRPFGIFKDIPLPKVKEAGIQMILKNRTSSFLEFQVRTTYFHANQELYAIAEINGEGLSKKTLILDDTLSFQVQTDGIAEGIIRVSLVNKTGTTLAQRSVFIFRPGSRVICKTESGRNSNQGIKTLMIDVQCRDRKSVNADISVSLADDIISPGWNQGPDIHSWFLLGNSSRALPRGYFSNPANVDPLLLDNLMLTRIDSTITWNQEFSKAEIPSTTNRLDYRDRLLKLYQSRPFEQIVAQFHKDQFFNRYFMSGMNSVPAFIRSNMSDLEEMGIIPARPTQQERIQRQLEIGVPLLSVLKSVKYYELIGDQVFFRPKRTLYPKGALFLIDGIPKGNSIVSLRDYSSNEFTNIEVSLATSDVLKYDGESDGIIFLSTKKESEPAPDSRTKPVRKYNPTLYWNPDLTLNGDGPVNLPMPRPELKSSWRLVMVGVDGNGNYFEGNNLIK